MSLLSDHARRSVERDQQHFAHAAPFRHVVIDDFLQPEFCRRILDDFPSFENRFALNEMGEVGKKAARPDVKSLSDAYRDLDAFLQTREFLDYVSNVTGIPDLHYDPDYVGGGTHENLHGQSLAPHVDFNHHPRTKEHRRLNLIVYLNPEWDSGWGGELALHSDPWNDAVDQKKTVTPMFNRAVIFETNEISWHSFDEIRLPPERRTLSRKSFAIYLYTREREATEAAPEHATVYVPDAMPHDWQPGRVLNADDLSLLQRRFADLRGHLRFLYDREKRFSADLADARDARRLPLQGYALQSAAPIGWWPDGWVSDEFSTSFVPQRKLKAIELEISVPDAISDQQLRLDVNGKPSQLTTSRGRRSQFTIDCRCAAGTRVDLAIHAEQAFVPARDGTSGDERALAWLLIAMRLVH